MQARGWLSDSELRFINIGRSRLIRPKSNRKLNIQIPWVEFLSNIPYLSVVCIHFCSDWGYLLILSYLPSYWRNVYQVATTPCRVNCHTATSRRLHARMRQTGPQGEGFRFMTYVFFYRGLSR
eukprot:1366981-Amorphochlora_amoeboformis.AAC.1